MNRVRPELRLDRILDALGAELAEATDEDVLAAAEELGMKPDMKGTAAFLGVKLFVVPYRGGNYGGFAVTTEDEECLNEDDSTRPHARK